MIKGLVDSFTAEGEESSRVENEIKAIFFESSVKKEFEGLQEKEAFFHKWLGVYLDHFKKYSFVFLDEESAKVLGYIVCCPDTLNSLQLTSASAAWQDYYKEFPAHLHINCHQDSRGRGVGSKLLIHLENVLKDQSISGLHLITEESARNISFYEKNGYLPRATRDLEFHRLVFLAKKLL
jgi:ribosomal protein S18 acetylase RimI-like enzyme